MNNKVLFFFFSVLFAFQASSHEYFFGFAEMEYREKEQKIELTLILSAHDVQSLWLERKVISKGFHALQSTAQSIYQDLERMDLELQKEFQIINKGQTIKLALNGFDLTENGMVQFYFSAEEVVLESEFEVHFANLMKDYEQQQNKITYRNNGSKQTAVFLQQQQTQKLNR